MSDKPALIDVLSLILKEADAYDSIERIERLVENEQDLSPLPLQPLYSALQNLDPEQTALALSKMSAKQRRALLDIDLWVKDDLDVDNFCGWLKIYSYSEDEKVRREFARSEELLLFMKGRLNIWTFDVEEPEYPDHDYYFLTDDQLLCVEYDEEFPYPKELQQIIRELYAEMGVESAYAYLFKMVSDSMTISQEAEYQAKKSRLAEYGIVDYYDALEIDMPLASNGHIDLYIKKKELAFTPDLSNQAFGQTLPSSALVAYKDKLNILSEELSKIQNQKRWDFLHFNFIRLVNATASARQALKEGRIALTRIGHRTRVCLLLGFDYVQKFLAREENAQFRPEMGVFQKFDFIDLYKIGTTLIRLRLNILKKNLKSFALEDEREAFMGKSWVDFLDESFSEPPRFNSGSINAQKGVEITTMEIYEQWSNKVDECLDFIPFISTFYFNLDKLIEEGKVQDHFYLNYAVADIDFEAIILSTFAHFMIGAYSTEANPEGVAKMGLSIPEFRKFCALCFDKKTGEVKNLAQLQKTIDGFKTHFKIEQIKGFDVYLHTILKAQLEGYDYENLKDEDFKHVGGPILLSLN